MKRRDAVRYHSERSAKYSQAAVDAKTYAAAVVFDDLADKHQEFADQARLGEYPQDLDD